MKLPSNKTTNIVLHDFGVVHMSLQLNTQFLSCITNDIRKAHNKGTRLAST